MKRLTLIVSGNVQKTGYRDIVMRLGMALGLRGYAENLPDGRVKVVAEGEEKKLELLKESANIKNALINVEKIESSFSEATGEFSAFFKLVREGETDERLDRAAELLKDVIVAMNQGFSGLNNTLTSGFNRLGDGQDRMLEKQDRMLEKQDTTIQILRNVSEELRSVHEDTTDMKSTLSRIEVDVKDTKFSLSAFIEEKYQKLEGEIAEIKETLARMQESKVT